MLKITIIDTPTEQKLRLEGRLAEPELSELREVWHQACEARGARTCVVDLRGVTFIDENGEGALMRMKGNGAQFVACGVSTTHQLSELGIECLRSKNQ